MKTKDVKLSLPNFIASNLRVLRRREGWSQSQLAERVGLNRGNIASYENENAEPSICKLLRISNLFGITTQDITRRDLQDDTELALSRSNYQHRGAPATDRYDHYHQRAAKLNKLLGSSRELFDHKQESLVKPCKEAEMVAAQYQQLYELTQQIAGEHQRLLEELRCQCE